MTDVLVLGERVRNTIKLGEGHFQEFKSAFRTQARGSGLGSCCFGVNRRTRHTLNENLPAKMHRAFSQSRLFLFPEEPGTLGSGLVSCIESVCQPAIVP